MTHLQIKRLEEIKCLAEDYMDAYLQDELCEPELCIDERQHRMIRSLNDALSEYRMAYGTR